MQNGGQIFMVANGTCLVYEVISPQYISEPKDIKNPLFYVFNPAKVPPLSNDDTVTRANPVRDVRLLPKPPQTPPPASVWQQHWQEKKS